MKTHTNDTPPLKFLSQAIIKIFSALFLNQYLKKKHRRIYP
jgi:hypothetical protein